MSQAGDLNSTNSVVPSDVAIDYVTDSGTAIAAANILNVLGGDNATTQGSSNNLTIDAFAPNKTYTFFKDFFSGENIGSFNSVDGTATNPGIAQVQDAAGTGYIYNGNNSTWDIVFGASTITVNFVINLFTLSTAGNRYKVVAGITRNAPGVYVVPNDGVYFTYTDNENSGKWVLNCSSGGITTSVNTSIAGSTSFVNLGISINSAGTSVSFTINGVSAGSAITTNIPTLALSLAILWIRSSGVLAPSLIDLISLKQTLTTPR